MNIISIISIIVIIFLNLCVICIQKKTESHLPLRLNNIQVNPVDIVITWVDSSDIKWQQSKQYYYNDNSTDNEEIRFPDINYPELELTTTIEFILKNIEWCRKIFIVTADGQVPKCYDKLNKIKNNIKIVHHSQIWPEDMLDTLPTFNSHAIECNIHRIKDLSNNFIYFNDDMYVVKKLNYSDMFYGDNIVIQPLHSKPPSKSNKVWSIVWNNMYDMYDMTPPQHFCYALTKNAMYLSEKSIYQHWRKTISNRFRSNDDVAPIGYTINFALKTKIGYLTNNKLKLFGYYNEKGIFKYKKNTNANIICINETIDIQKSIKSIRDNCL
jgi:hypothetical protein